MQEEFDMSMMRELTFFPWTSSKENEIWNLLCQTKYCTKLIKKFSMEKCREALTPMTTSTYLDLYEKR